MQIRTADRSDVDAIRDVARRSFSPSRVVRPEVIDHLLSTRFDEEDVDVRLDSEETVCLIAEADGEQVGFAEGSVDDGGVDWLHVVPEFRGRGVGTALFERLASEIGLLDGDEPDRAPVPESAKSELDAPDLRLDREDLTAGTEEPFVGVVDEDRPGRYGVVCTNCETVIEGGEGAFSCPECGNERRF